jgi:hypothetical protein
MGALRYSRDMISRKAYLMRRIELAINQVRKSLKEEYIARMNAQYQARNQAAPVDAPKPKC